MLYVFKYRQFYSAHRPFQWAKPRLFSNELIGKIEADSDEDALSQVSNAMATKSFDFEGKKYFAEVMEVHRVLDISALARPSQALSCFA